MRRSARSRARASALHVMVVAAATGISGCTLFLPETFVGRYTLVSIEGSGLPYVLATSDTLTVEALSGYLQADDGGSFVFGMSLRTSRTGAEDSVDLVESAGIWSQTTEGVTLFDVGGETYPTDFRDGQLTFSASGRTYVLRR